MKHKHVHFSQVSGDVSIKIGRQWYGLDCNAKFIDNQLNIQMMIPDDDYLCGHQYIRLSKTLVKQLDNLFNRVNIKLFNRSKVIDTFNYAVGQEVIDVMARITVAKQ